MMIFLQEFNQEQNARNLMINVHHMKPNAALDYIAKLQLQAMVKEEVTQFQHVFYEYTHIID